MSRRSQIVSVFRELRARDYYNAILCLSDNEHTSGGGEVITNKKELRAHINLPKIISSAYPN